MRAWLQNCWPVLKALLTVAILVAIGWRFARDLQNPELWARPLHGGWLALSGGLYILGLAFSAWFWHRLLRVFGQQPSTATTVRAYFLGHLGKYLPGKAVALVLRATLARGPGVRTGVAGLTAFYEVLTTMTSGALLGVILLALFAPVAAAPFDRETFWQLLRLEVPASGVLGRGLLVLLALTLLGPLMLPILPGFFNRIVGGIVERFRAQGAPPLARVPTSALIEGLVITAVCWLLWGLSLWAVFRAVCQQPLAWDWVLWLRWTGLMAVAYVAGFVIILAPGGLGVREFFLTLFLVPEIGLLDTSEPDPRAVVVLAVVLLRLAWTVAEVVIAAAVYWLPDPVATHAKPDNAWQSDQPTEVVLASDP